MEYTIGKCIETPLDLHTTVEFTMGGSAKYDYYTAPMFEFAREKPDGVGAALVSVWTG
jgi:hypothetical protein